MSIRAFIKTLTSASETRQRTRRSAFFARLSVESLEDRRVLSFVPTVSYPVELDPGAVVTGDFNADGRPDLAAANVSSNTVSVLLGNGDGTFQAARSSDAGDAHGGYSDPVLSSDGGWSGMAGRLGGATRASLNNVSELHSVVNSPSVRG